MSPVRGTSMLPISRTPCGRSLGNRPRASVRSFGSRPNVEGCDGETVLVCMPAADAVLEGSRPYDFDQVYEANACQPVAQRLSVVMTRPSYVDAYVPSFRTG